MRSSHSRLATTIHDTISRSYTAYTRVTGSAAAGGAYLALAQFGSQLAIGLLVLAIARITTPSAFAIVTVEALAASIASVLSDAGFGTAAVRAETAVRRQLGTIAVLTGLILGTASTIAIALAAGLYDSRALTALPIALAIPWSAFSAGVGGVALGERRFFLVATAQSLGAAALLLGGFLAIATNRAISAVPIAFLVGQAVTSIALFAGGRGWATPTRVSKASRDHVAFAVKTTLSNALNFVGANIDYAIVGALLGIHALGLYSFAYALTTSFQTRIVSALNRAAYPLLATAGRERRPALVLIMWTFVAIWAGLAYVGLMILAPQLVPELFGNQWVDAVPLVRLLSIGAFLLTIGSTMGPVVLAAGRAGILLTFSMVRIVGVAAAVAVGSSFGVVGATAGSVTYAVVAVPLSLAAASWAVGLSRRGIVRIISHARTWIGVTLLGAIVALSGLNIWVAGAGVAIVAIAGAMVCRSVVSNNALVIDDSKWNS